MLFDEQVEKVVIPGFQGQMTLLPDHMTIVSRMSAGYISVTCKNESPKVFPVVGGYVDMHENQCLAFIDDQENLLLSLLEESH